MVDQGWPLRAIVEIAISQAEREWKKFEQFFGSQEWKQLGNRRRRLTYVFIFDNIKNF